MADNKKYQVMEELTAEEYAELKESIRQKGILLPVEIDQDGNVIDGYNRSQIAKELQAEGITVDVPTRQKVYKNEEEKRETAYILNMKRRQLDKDGKKRIAEKMLKEFPAKSNRQIAEVVNLNHETVGAIRKKLESGGEIRHQDKVVGKDGVSQPVKTSINTAGIYGISCSKTGEGISKIMLKSHELAEKLGISRHVMSGVPTKLAKQLQLDIVAMNMPETMDSHNKAVEYIKAELAKYLKGENEVFTDTKKTEEVKVDDTVGKRGRPPKPEPELPKEEKEQLERLNKFGAELYEEKPVYIENLDTVLTDDLHDSMKQIAMNLKNKEDAKKAYAILTEHMKTITYVQQILIGKGGV